MYVFDIIVLQINMIQLNHSTAVGVIMLQNRTGVQAILAIKVIIFYNTW